MSDRSDIEKMLPKAPNIEEIAKRYNDEYANGYLRHYSDCTDALVARQVGEEEIKDLLYAIWSTKISSIKAAKALRSKYIILRRG
jgi:hypothetical protein